MTMLVTLTEAKEHLRVPFDVEDDDLVSKIMGASAAVLSNIKRSESDLTDPDEIAVVRSATLMLVDSLYTDRGGDSWNGNSNYLPKGVAALLYPLRKPSVA